MAGKKLEVVVVGGSTAGLMHGIVLKRLGHNVQVLEQQPAARRTGQAAGISVSLYTQQFLQKFDLVDKPFYVPASGLQHTDTEFNFGEKWPIEYKMTNWQALYHRLRANFDGLKSVYVPSPPASQPTDGRASYIDQSKVSRVSLEGEKVKLEVEDMGSGEHRELQADLVIAADGAHSSIRRQLCPSVTSPYCGYVAYRGTVPETAISKETLAIFNGKAFLCRLRDKSYAIVYIIPGDGGEVDIGKRSVNFVWYSNLPAGSQEFNDTMTDAEGVVHQYSLPIGKMQSQISTKLKNYGREILPPPLQEIMENIPSPFVTTISDYECPNATFFNNKLFLVGDAFALFRPHVAQSTNQTAMHCLSLEKVLTGEMSADEWQRSARVYAHRTRLWSNSLGTEYLSNSLTHYYHYFRFRLATVAERWGYII